MISDELCFMKNICKTFNCVQVLNNVNIGLRMGEIHAVIGSIGAGKSVLMRILAGLEQPTSGEIYIDGQRLKGYNTSQMVKLGISLISHDMMLVPSLSVLDNILLGKYPKNGRLGYLDKKAAEEIGKKTFELLNYQIDLNRKVETFGMAEKRLIALVKALCCNAKILILDEAELGLSDTECESFYNELVKLKRYGVSTFFISQRLKTVLRISDRISMLDDGRITWTRSNTPENYNKIQEKLCLGIEKKGYPKLNPQIGANVLQVMHLSNSNVLKDVSFELNKGEILGVTGAAGSGRTSLAKSLFGMDRSCRGDILIHKVKSHIQSPEEAIRLKMGYIQEDAENDLVPAMSAIENLTLANIKGISHGKLLDLKLERSNLTFYLDRIGFPKSKHKCAVRELSCGERQKVIISKWLFSGADIIILDEPTNSLDVVAKVEFYNILTSLASEGLSFLLISTDFSELCGMCDRVLILKDGMVSEEIRKEDLKPYNILSKVY